MLPNFPLIFGKSHYVAFCLVISSSMNFTKKIRIIILMLELTQLPTTLAQISPRRPRHLLSWSGASLPPVKANPPTSAKVLLRLSLQIHSPLFPSCTPLLGSGGVNHSPALWLRLEFWPTGLCRRLGRGRRGRSADTAPWAPPG